MNRKYFGLALYLWAGLIMTTAGCGGGQTNAMTADFTEEQKAAILAEQEAVFAEESGGVVNKKSRKKKS